MKPVKRIGIIVMLLGCMWVFNNLNTPPTAQVPPRNYRRSGCHQKLRRPTNPASTEWRWWRNTNQTNPTQPSQGADEVKNVALKPGKILIADAGTEFIVRSGNAVIYTEVASGVADLTDGKDLLNGETAPKNHLLSFPREGRGIQVKEGQTSNLIVMVRGGYTIK